MKVADVKITDNSDLVKKAKDEAIAKALEAIGLQAEGYAKLLCPVDTGLLRNSITHAVAGGSTSINKYTGSELHGDTPTTQRNKVAGKPASPPHSGEYSGTVGSTKEQVVYIGSNVEYASYVEKGTQRTKAQPFIKPAAENHTSEYKAIAEAMLKGS